MVKMLGHQPQMVTSLRAKESQPRSMRVRLAILRAADILIHERGYLNVSIEAIAARARVGKQTIYRRWPTKADLYMELYTVLADEIMQPSDTGCLAEDLRQRYQSLLSLFRNTSAGATLAGLIAEAQASPDFARKLYIDLVTKRRSSWISILARGRARAEIPEDTDLEFAVDLLSGPVWYRLLLGHAPLDPELGENLVHSILDGLRDTSANTQR